MSLPRPQNKHCHRSRGRASIPGIFESVRSLCESAVTRHHHPRPGDQAVPRRGSQRLSQPHHPQRRTVSILLVASSSTNTPSGVKARARAKELEAQGLEIIHLEIGELDFDTPAHVVEAGVTALQNGRTRYGPAAGTVELREAIAGFIEETRGVPAGSIGDGRAGRRSRPRRSRGPGTRRCRTSDRWRR